MKENRNKPFILMSSLMLAVVGVQGVEIQNQDIEYEQATTEYQSQIKEMGETNALVIEQIENEKDTAVKKLNGDVKNLESKVNEKDKRIAEYEKVIKSLNEKNRQLNKKLSQKKAEEVVIKKTVSRTRTRPQLTTGKSLGVFEVSAYTNRKEEGTNGITASGKPTVEGVTIACDRDVLPMGSRVYIEGVGTRTCQDVGGGIRGKEIDLFVEDLDYALEFGKKNLEVKLLN